jgi:hypothetical protein
MRRRTSSLVLALTVVLALVAGIGLRWLIRGRTTRTAGAFASAHLPAATLPTASPSERSSSHAAGAPNDGVPEPDRGDDELADFDNPPEAWATVDLDAIRAALPDNTYWKMAVPTKDPEVLRQREEERARWNVEYGKVLSNTATDEEIDTYYAERQRLSEDYLQFIVYLLTNYGYQIPKRDVAALKLAAEMHHERLEEIPRKITEAHERHQAHDAARRAWLEEQRAFGLDTPQQPE